MKRRWVWGVVGAVVVGGGAYLYLRRGPAPRVMEGASRTPWPERMNPEPPAWLPTRVSHPCETCGTCEHELDLRRHHYEMSIKRREGPQEVQYWFADVDAFAEAVKVADVFDAAGRLLLKGRYLAARHTHRCGGDEFVSTFDARYLWFATAAAAGKGEAPAPFKPTIDAPGGGVWKCDGVLPTYGCDCGK